MMRRTPAIEDSVGTTAIKMMTPSLPPEIMTCKNF